MTGTALCLLIIGLCIVFSVSPTAASNGKDCDTVLEGYQCRPDISHSWGQYSPYYRVPSEISTEVPRYCKVNLASVLSRHGARDPTAGKTIVYAALVAKLHTNVKLFSGKYAFLKDYEYALGADQLTAFGQQELFNSGVKFYRRYKSLTRHLPIFVRSADQDRVVESAKNFTQGYHSARSHDDGGTGEDDFPYPILEISEADGMNNTLNHDLCTAFENGPVSEIGDNAQLEWQDVFAPSVLKRLNQDLPGADLTIGEVVLFMDLCPFNTIASPTGKISPFCDLFSKEEWRQYDYFQSIGKYYGYGSGNPLGPTQGVGYVNELIARLTEEPVSDHTTVNHTLDDSQETFPTGPGHQLFADFSHDNDMTAIFAALGLYSSTESLSNTTYQSPAQSGGYSASWTVPFAARAYFERLTCEHSPEELVRVLVNDRVIPLPMCDGDNLGRCKLSKFVKSLSFARSGGKWDSCFV